MPFLNKDIIGDASKIIYGLYGDQVEVVGNSQSPLMLVKKVGGHQPFFAHESEIVNEKPAKQPTNNPPPVSRTPVKSKSKRK